MRHGSLFSGIGGFDLAAQWMGWENVFQVEWDEYCQKVLAKNFPNVKRYGDIKEFKGERHSVDILTGGFPCQPFSHAGKRKGESDDRYLWPEYLRIIREIQPSYVVGENVAGLVSMEDGKTLDGILSDLEGEGYETEQFIIPASAVQASHDRSRIWIVAYIRSNTNNIKRPIYMDGVSVGKEGENRVNVWSEHNRDFEYVYESKPYEPIEPAFCGNDARLSKKLDESRIKGLGNAIVPQVAYEIFKAIDD